MVHSLSNLSQYYRADDISTAVQFKIRGCILKFPDWPPGARTANGTTLCHWVQLYHYFAS
jgi:hypothetical protein